MARQPPYLQPQWRFLILGTETPGDEGNAVPKVLYALADEAHLVVCSQTKITAQLLRTPFNTRSLNKSFTIVS
jgi:hypothetical protein